MSNEIKRKIGEFTYWLEDNTEKDEGDWVISKHQIDMQIGESNQYMNWVFEKPFEIGIGQCKVDNRFNPPMIYADSIVMTGNALQERTYKIIKSDNPAIGLWMTLDDLIEQEKSIFDSGKFEDESELKEKIQIFLDSEDNELNLDFIPLTYYDKVLEELGYECIDADTNECDVDFWYTYLKDETEVTLDGSLWNGSFRLIKNYDEIDEQ